MAIVYLDSSAIVKLLVEERESAALLKALRGEDRHVTSRIATIEVARAALRRGGVDAARLRRLMEPLDVVELSAAIAATAASIGPADLRTLDAIHLATALALREELATFLSYDERLNAAARLHGLTVSSPGRTAASTSAT